MSIYVWTKELQKRYVLVEVEPITTPWIYWNKSLGLISLSSNWTDWITIADKNLGATEVYDWTSAPNQANSWNYYQRWNNNWFSFTWSISTSSSQVNASSYWPWNYYSSNTFITRSSSPYWWDSSNNDNLWWWITWTAISQKWPCAEWFHVPTNTEWDLLVNAWISLSARTSWSWTPFKALLKLPFAWYRDRSNSNTSSQWTAWRYFSSIWYDSVYVRAFWFNSSTVNTALWAYRSYWYSIRPFKNIAVQPYEWWVALYELWWLKSYEQLQAMTIEQAETELNTEPVKYFNKLNWEWHLILHESWELYYMTHWYDRLYYEPPLQEWWIWI